MSCEKRIDRAISKGTTLLLGKCSRYAVFSDCHRGCGNMSDNFLRNQHLYFAALEHYYAEGFYYLELGDGEELWENRCLKRIQDSHSNVYQMFACLKRKNRFCKIYGNHDMELRKELPESIRLKNQAGGRDVCMIHGHQADFLILSAGGFPGSLCGMSGNRWNNSASTIRQVPPEITGKSINMKSIWSKQRKKRMFIWWQGILIVRI